MNVKSLRLPELEEYIVGLGLKRYRYLQVRDWIYGKNVLSWDEMSNISVEDRKRLASACRLEVISPVKRELADDATEKILFKLADNNCIETVIIPDGDRLTLCLSTQVGCKMGCFFCLTGYMGFTRNLESYEILEQVMAVMRLYPEMLITNLVFMGMGEPLDNLDNLLNALETICDPHGLAFSPRRVTLSTAGLVPEMLRFGKVFPHINLAISLNGTTDEARGKIMPVNKKYPIEKLMKGVFAYPLPRRKKISYGYVMIMGLNDSNDDARRLLSLLKGVRAKVNIILLNKISGFDMEPASMERALSFQRILLEGNLSTTIRRSKGSQIMAACGQLSWGEA